MNIKAAFPTKYLKADDLLDGDFTVTIREIKIEDVGSTKSEEKPIIYFKEVDKGVVCNKTNSNTIAKLYGDETDGWIGKQIILFATEVDFQGEQVLAIRVRMRKPTTAPSPRQTSLQPAPPSNGAGMPSPRAAAWEAFKTANPDMSNEELTDPWRALLKTYAPDRSSTEFSASDWTKVKQIIETPVTSPISQDQQFEEDQIPF